MRIFFKFSRSLEVHHVYQCSENDGTGLMGLWEIGGQTWPKHAFFKPPKLPHSRADSPRSKTVFFRVRRTITRIIQIGGLTPLRGRKSKGQKIMKKTAVKRVVTSKPEVEIYRGPQKSTFWPWFPIHSPIHFRVYLAPLLSYNGGILALHQCETKCFVYKVWPSVVGAVSAIDQRFLVTL